MKYLVIGLGIYGANLSVDLTDMGHEVVGVDVKGANVESIKDYISAAYILDASDEQAISVLPLKSVDVVIVAIGENFGASIKTVALLKKIGVEHIYARATDSLHQSILEGLNVERILTPEQRAARDLAKEFELDSDIQSLNVSSDSYVMKFEATSYFTGIKYRDLDLMKRFGLTLIAATRPVETTNMLGMKHLVEQNIDINSSDREVTKGDCFTCYGTIGNFKKMMKEVS
ncbi:MAG: TrkA family potassium uptake protein [Muribaculaceae bacterium]|nr:TrkA family potassium uptake protein [Muribaculaceae bacterium]